jgi:uncharacterized membrane protein
MAAIHSESGFQTPPRQISADDPISAPDAPKKKRKPVKVNMVNSKEKKEIESLKLKLEKLREDLKKERTERMNLKKMNTRIHRIPKKHQAEASSTCSTNE